MQILESNDPYSAPTSLSSIVDLLNMKGISWGEYQEDLPYSAFLGYYLYG
jgi:acid phosphatase